MMMMMMMMMMMVVLFLDDGCCGEGVGLGQDEKPLLVAQVPLDAAVEDEVGKYAF